MAALDNVNNEGETSRDYSVGIDEAWQKRGHIGLSLNGVVSVSSLDTGKILDVKVLTNTGMAVIVFQQIMGPAPHECLKTSKVLVVEWRL